MNSWTLDQLLKDFLGWTAKGLLFVAASGLIIGCGGTSDRSSVPASRNDDGERTSPAPPPPPPPPGSFLAQLQPDVNTELLGLGIPIAIPTYLPPGFDLATYDAGVSPDGNATGPYYALVYRNAESQCFAIEATSGGVGGPVLERRLPIDSPIFGSSYVLYAGQIESLNAPATAAVPDLVSDWLAGDVALYRYIGAQLTMDRYGETSCIDLSAEEAVKIVESLAYLPSTIYGDYLEDPLTPPEGLSEPVVVPGN